MKQIVPKLSGIARLGWLTLIAILVTASLVQASEPGKPAPAWKLKDLEGKKVSLEDFKGKIVVLNFWATWCPPCVKEVPDFIALQKQYGADGVAFVGVAVDDDKKDLKKFIEKEGVNYPILISTDKVLKDYGDVGMIPTTFVIDREGKITAKHAGLVEKAVLEADLKPLVKK